MRRRRRGAGADLCCKVWPLGVAALPPQPLPVPLLVLLLMLLLPLPLLRSVLQQEQQLPPKLQPALKGGRWGPPFRLSPLGTQPHCLPPAREVELMWLLPAKEA